MIIYFNKEKTNFQVIRPTHLFDGDWKGLADALTNSGKTKYGEIKNYHSFEIL